MALAVTFGRFGSERVYESRSTAASDLIADTNGSVLFVLGAGGAMESGCDICLTLNFSLEDAEIPGIRHMDQFAIARVIPLLRSKRYNRQSAVESRPPL